MTTQRYYIGKGTNVNDIAELFSMLLGSEVSFDYHHEEGEIIIRSYSHDVFDTVDEWILDNDVAISPDREALQHV